jgi:hypothetical protein
MVLSRDAGRVLMVKDDIRTCHRIVGLIGSLTQLDV